MRTPRLHLTDRTMSDGQYVRVKFVRGDVGSVVREVRAGRADQTGSEAAGIEVAPCSAYAAIVDRNVIGDVGSVVGDGRACRAYRAFLD